MAILRDNIADAEDGMPSAEGLYLDISTSSLSSFTTEADDPFEIEDWGGTIGYTAWTKLVVSSPAGAVVTLSVVVPSGVVDAVMFVYDEVPTVASMSIAVDDDSQPAPHDYWPEIPDLTLPAGTYYVCVTPYDGSGWDTGEGDDLTLRVNWTGTPGTPTFSLDAILKRTWLPPLEPSLPVLQSTNAAAVDNNADITVLQPVGTLLEGDLIVISISRDTQTLTLGMNLFPVDLGWTFVGETMLTNGDQAITSWYRRWSASDPAYYTFRNYLIASPWATAMAAGIVAYRGAVSAQLMTPSSSSGTTYHGGAHTTPAFSAPGGDPQLGEYGLWHGVWAGASAGIVNWDWDATLPAIYPLISTTASNYASIGLGFWLERYISPTPHSAFATLYPSGVANQPDLMQVLWIHGPTPRFGLSAYLGPAGFFSLDAFINTATQVTRHPRTGPHFDTSPDTAITLSAALGALPPGATLHEALIAIDDLISQRERGA